MVILIVSRFCLLSILYQLISDIGLTIWHTYILIIKLSPKSILIYHKILYFVKKKHIPRGIKLKLYAKFYYNDMLCCNKKGGYDVTCHLQRYFSYIVAVNFIGGGNRSTRRKPSICSKSLINFLPYI